MVPLSEKWQIWGMDSFLSTCHLQLLNNQKWQTVDNSRDQIWVKARNWTISRNCQNWVHALCQFTWQNIYVSQENFFTDTFPLRWESNVQRLGGEISMGICPREDYRQPILTQWRDYGEILICPNLNLLLVLSRILFGKKSVENDPKKGTSKMLPPQWIIDNRYLDPFLSFI